MKLPYIYFSIILIFCVSCYPIDREADSKYVPLLMTRVQLEKSVSWGPARQLLNPGKIYYKDSYIFINEKFKGVHVIDNQNPKSPNNIGFIQAPGNVDIAIKANSLYLDNATDLIAVDISSLENLTVTERIPDVFPEILPPDKTYIPSTFEKDTRPSNTIIVGWEKKQ